LSPAGRDAIVGPLRLVAVDYAGVGRIFFDADLHNASAWLRGCYGSLRLAFVMQIMHGMHNIWVQSFRFQVQSWGGRAGWLGGRRGRTLAV